MTYLYFKDKNLGYIENISVEGLWMRGLYHPYPEGKMMEEFFTYMTNGDLTQNPPFHPDLLDDKNWWVMEEDGTRRGIWLPAIRDMKFISWRWRRS
jgi:hypothetical protein